MGCAIYIPHIDKSWLFKLNPFTSSFTAEALAIDKSLKLVNAYSWSHVNICSDSLSVLQALKNSELSLFPKASNKLNVVLAELLHKITKINSTENRVRFTWCPAHVGIEYNEKVDSLAKEASIRGELWNNNISCSEIISSFNLEYTNIDNSFYLSGNNSAGSYYLNNFREININYVRKIVFKKEDCDILTRLITGYPMTRAYLFKMNVVDSPECYCGERVQTINHVFWACPILESERLKLLKLLRNLKLFDPFCIEYVMSNLNKKIAAILTKFIKIINSKLNLSI